VTPRVPVELKTFAPLFRGTRRVTQQKPLYHPKILTSSRLQTLPHFSTAPAGSLDREPGTNRQTTPPRPKTRGPPDIRILPRSSSKATTNQAAFHAEWLPMYYIAIFTRAHALSLVTFLQAWLLSIICHDDAQ
jgi:hypothetical protein